MTDIAERLRIKADMILMCEKIKFGSDAAVMQDAAVEIERLREALEPFANALKGNWSSQSGSMKIVAGPHANDLRLELTLYDFRRAALAQEKA